MNASALSRPSAQICSIGLPNLLVNGCLLSTAIGPPGVFTMRVSGLAVHELSPKFLEEEELDLNEVVAFLWYVVDKGTAKIIDVILTGELGMTDSDDMLSHPLYQAEFSVQTRMLEYLRTDAPATSEQKDLFREKK